MAVIWPRIRLGETICRIELVDAPVAPSMVRVIAENTSASSPVGISGMSTAAGNEISRPITTTRMAASRLPSLTRRS